MSGNESVHASPDTEVSHMNSFSEEVGNASGNVSDVPKMETPTYSDSGISGNIESEQRGYKHGRVFCTISRIW